METSRFTANKPEDLKKEIIKNNEEKFIPKGAIAFFLVLVFLGLAIWYGIYFLMLDRI